ncbi:hypothetical protein MicB006_2788 [Micromonospora sp. B006]|nr:hypothetical protein MicB006_2788 [Micromonospora sp. B006]
MRAGIRADHKTKARRQLSSPLSTYIAPRVLPQGPGHPAEFSAGCG